VTSPTKQRPWLATTAVGRYPLLLALIAVDVGSLLVLTPADGGLVVLAALTAATLVLGVLAADAPQRVVRIAIVAGLAGIASAVGQATLGTGWLETVTWASLSALIVGAMLAIGRDILRATMVSLDTLVAAVCLYVLIGLAFAFLDLAVNAALGTFFAQEGPHPPADFVYFSYVVLSTVGFGDLSPAGQLPRAVVVLEAIAGPIFLVTALARLVSLYSAPPRR
jgi:hypothetical protein